MLGSARRSILMSEHEREMTAHHEAGHTIVAKILPGSDPVHKVTIVPRGLALGVTQQLPTEDRYTVSRDFLLNRLAILMGGRAADLAIYGQESSGAGQDIKMATDLARKMVAQWGMSILGPINMDNREDMVFLGRELSTQREMSEHTSQRVDREIKRMIMCAHDLAGQVIRDNLGTMKALATALLERETLEVQDIDAILAAGNEPS
jgi:cell division protease FtsH